MDSDGNDQTPSQPHDTGAHPVPGWQTPATTPPAPGTVPTVADAPVAAALPPGPPGPPGPPADPWAPPPGHDGTPPRARWRGPTDPGGPRPVPTLSSMLAVGGGLLAASGLFFVLGELDSYDQRTVGLIISVLFLALGVAISTLTRSTRAANAGVAISAVSVLPLTVFLFANADVFGKFEGDVQGDPWDGLRGIVILMLGTAAALWLVGYFLGPGRRYGFYLGAALIAIWLIPISHMQITALEDTMTSFQSFDSSSSFDTIPDSGFDSSFDEDDFNSQFDDDFTVEEPDVSDPSTKIGVVSLLFGAAYLALAAIRDRRGDASMATAAVVPGVLIVLYGTSLLTAHVGWVGAGLLGIAVGSAILAVGLRGARRFSSWVGVLVATIGLGSLVVNLLEDSPRAIGAALTVMGVMIALVVGWREQQAPTPTSGPAPDGFGTVPPGGPAPAAHLEPSPYGPPPTVPTAPAVPPAYGAPGPAAPTFTPPTPPPATPPTDGASPWSGSF